MKISLATFMALIGTCLGDGENVIVRPDSEHDPRKEVINFELPSFNFTLEDATAVPTPPTTVQSPPTESPVPSPSPTHVPTAYPSATDTPTPVPTELPTESPAPSPSPTTTPTNHPTATPTPKPSELPSISPSDAPTNLPSESPSGLPTVTPSVGPTNFPTSSPMPSPYPSVHPTPVPSLFPTISPSNSPTVSPAPSQAPTFSPTAFPTTQPSYGPTMEPSITPVPTETPTTSQPSLAHSGVPSYTPTETSIPMSTVLEVTIDLHDTIGTFLQGIFETETRDFINDQLNEDEVETEQDVRINVTSVKIIDQTIIPARRRMADGRALHAAGLRIRFNATADVKPGSPPNDFVFANEVGRPFEQNYPLFVYRLSEVHPVFKGLVEDSNSENAFQSIQSGDKAGANGIQAGAFAGIIVAAIAAAFIAIAAAYYAFKNKNRLDENDQGRRQLIDVYELSHSDSASTGMTPFNEQTMSPATMESGFMGANYSSAPNTSLLDEIQNDSDSVSQEGFDVGAELDKVVLQAQSGRHSEDPPAVFYPPSTDPRQLNVVPTSSLCFSDAENCTPTSVELTPAASTPGDSVFSNFGLGNVLGARPMNDSEQEEFNTAGETPVSNKTEKTKRSGLYDVFAPSGPLGIVVDTTRDGPVVHSMKPTSPLLGLISPGDLIVGLDDMDTRSMTAATLTRLMAKRSHQKERKITLLAVEGGI